MVGCLIASVLMGPLGDKYGRRTATLIFVSCLLAGNVASIFSFSYPVFLVGQILSGTGGLGIFNICTVIVTEISTQKWRGAVNVALAIGNGFGRLIAVAAAFVVRDWRWFEAVFTLPVVFALLIVWFVPENPRWLLVNGRVEEVIQYFHKISRINGVKAPIHLLYRKRATVISTISLSSPSLDRSNKSNDNERENSKSGTNNDTTSSTSSVLMLLKIPFFRRSLLILLYIWFSVSAAFYGVSNNSSNLSGNFFLNIAATMFIELPAGILTNTTVSRFGRKRTLYFSVTFSCIVCICSGFLPTDISWPLILCNVTGKFGFTLAHLSLYLYTAEFFPTEFRALCLGICTLFLSFGGIVAPFICSMASYLQSLPLIAMGTLNLISAIFLLRMPETKGCKLPETIEDYKESIMNSNTNSLS